ncbi:hypothetical protein AALA82_14705 [Oscillospiraceae bacterium 50-16]
MNEKTDYLLAVKSKYTYRIYPNGNGEMSIEVQLSDDFKRSTLENFALATMSKDEFAYASLSCINYLFKALRKRITKSGSYYHKLPVY